MNYSKYFSDDDKRLMARIKDRVEAADANMRMGYNTYEGWILPDSVRVTSTMRRYAQNDKLILFALEHDAATDGTIDTRSLKVLINGKWIEAWISHGLYWDEMYPDDSTFTHTLLETSTVNYEKLANSLALRRIGYSMPMFGWIFYYQVGYSF